MKKRSLRSNMKKSTIWKIVGAIAVAAGLIWPLLDSGIFG